MRPTCNQNSSIWLANSMADQAETAAVGDLPPAPSPAIASCVRRKLVQSTLFPVTQKEQILRDDDCKGEEEDDGNEDDEEEEDWGSSSKKRKVNSSKKKANNSNSRTTPRSRASKKVVLNGKEISSKKVDDGDSPVTIKSDFFMKSSEKVNQKKQQDERLSDFSCQENDKPSNSPNKDERTPSKLTRQNGFIVEKPKTKKTTPKKKLANSDLIETLSKKTSSDTMLDGPTLQSIPNLRLEAKMTAQENSRLFAGKQIHPFFSLHKASKRNQEIIDLEGPCCSSERKNANLSFNPIHVFDMVEDGSHCLDWKNWSFSEGNLSSINSHLEDNLLSLYDQRVNSLQFDDFSRHSFPSIYYSLNSLCVNEWYANSHDIHEIGRRVKLAELIVLHGCLEAEKRQRCYCLTDNAIIKQWCSFMVDVKYGKNKLKKIKNRSSSNWPENCLWTDKYQPRRAAQICGNDEAVKFISQWLYLWHEKGSQSGKSSFHDEQTVGEDIDYSSHQSDTDSENIDEETSLKNVLLVMGPVGLKHVNTRFFFSGKSAAIYACAEEQGFQVLEVNASDWRNGALVKHRFGEALGSHWLQHKVDNTASSDKKYLSKSSPEIIEVTKGSEDEVVELIPLSDEDDPQLICSGNSILDCQNEIKTLILFEDVDATLSEDHGFLSTIQQLAQTAKRPMILTANNYNPILPNNLDRLEVSFKMPSPAELLGLGHMVCAAEKAEIEPWLINRLIDSCQGDIRKTIMYLQFWCQGQNSKKGTGSQITYSPLPFDLEAGHEVLPKLIPWGCPSRLSEIVEEEITKSLVMMEDRYGLVDIIVEEELNCGKPHASSRIQSHKLDHIEVKKEAILSLHSSIYDEDDLLAQPDCNCELSDYSGSPVAFSGSVRRKLGAVISSDSEEEYLGDNIPTLLGREFGDQKNEMRVVNSTSSPHLFPIGSCCHPTDQLTHVEEDKLKHSGSTCLENVVYSHMDGVCRSVDMSSVPEPSFVPETEFGDQTDLFSVAVSCSLMEVDSMSENLLPRFSSINDAKCCTPPYENQEMLSNDSDMHKKTLKTEEIGDSNLEHVEDGIRGHQMLDECSRVEFSGAPKTFKTLKPHQQVDFVEETWKRLRERKTDLQQYVTPQQKEAFQALKVASGMSKLISEADSLVTLCQSQICDSLEPSLSPCEESQLGSWYDDHLHMSSIMAQHGMCFYAKESLAVGSNRDSVDRVDLAWEMLSSSTNAMALGRLLSVDRKLTGGTEERSEMSRCSFRRYKIRRKIDSCLYNVLESVVPPRTHLALHGDAFHEYLSSLSKVSRLEAGRLAELASKREQRRARIARHYLSSGTFVLSPEDISLLSQYNSYRKFLPNGDIHGSDKALS
ncbi:unnamed protein product [Coffea canephora]|uniref:DH200=94 genomic scaffold, scaffold_226 n=1 Tax=Coffea canephora TaxID=49390 RepID=A0A068VF58_COFCA|nr:unnamed protein product [Coffea canephora]